jgi:hypothetical protein
MEIKREVKREKILTNATDSNITKNIQQKISDKRRPIFSARHFYMQKETLQHAFIKTMVPVPIFALFERLKEIIMK